MRCPLAAAAVRIWPYAIIPSAMEAVIEVNNLVKRYGSITAVDDISFRVYSGEIFGILGPNGAGKTTTMEIIEGLQKPTSGSTLVLGIDTQRDSNKVKERIGVQLQASAFFELLTLEELLSLFGSFYKRSVPYRELLSKVGLEERSGSTLKKLSGGQKQRFTLAASLVNDPELVILDEPTTGLDPQARRNVWELIRGVHSDAKTVVLTTHYMEEAEELCDRVAIMDSGSIVALDTPSNLLKSLAAPQVLKLVTSRTLGADEADQLKSSPEDTLVADGTAYQLRVKNGPVALAHVMDWAVRWDVTFEQMELVPATLEDVFLELTGKDLRD